MNHKYKIIQSSHDLSQLRFLSINYINKKCHFCVTNRSKNIVQEIARSIDHLRKIKKITRRISD